MKNKIYITRSTKTKKVRWAVVSPYGKMIGKGEVSLKDRKQLIRVVAELKRDFHTTTAYQLLSM